MAALERNLKSIRAALPEHIKYIAVVKADAYGHGMQQTVARLMQANVDMFAVANVLEAATIREIGTGWPIIVLGTTLENEESYLFEYDLIPTISTIEEVERLNRKARESGKPLKAHIKIDTGMGRLGIWHEYAAELFDAFRKATFLVLDGVYTHFASASQDPEFTRRQRKLFTETIAKVNWLETQKLLIHADNSAGISTLRPTAFTTRFELGCFSLASLPTRSRCWEKWIQPPFSNSSLVSVSSRNYPQEQPSAMEEVAPCNGIVVSPSYRGLWGWRPSQAEQPRRRAHQWRTLPDSWPSNDGPNNCRCN